jgi:hypothetical protein
MNLRERMEYLLEHSEQGPERDQIAGRWNRFHERLQAAPEKVAALAPFKTREEANAALSLVYGDVLDALESRN